MAEYNDEHNVLDVSCFVYVVKEGDTLYQIARMYDVTVFDLMCMNPYLNVYNLMIGDEICIPTVCDE